MWLQVYQTYQIKISKVLKDAANQERLLPYNFIHRLLKSVPNTEHNQLIHTLWHDLKNAITNALDLIKILKVLPTADRYKFIQNLGDELKNIIKGEFNLFLIIDELPESDRYAVIQFLGDAIKKIIKSDEGLSRILGALPSASNRYAVIQTLGDKIKKIIKGEFNLFIIIQYLPKSDRYAFIQFLGDEIKKIIKSGEGLFRILGDLPSPSNRYAVIQTLGDEIKKIIKNFKELNFILDILPEPNRYAVIQSLGDEIKNLIKNPRELLDLIDHLPIINRIEYLQIFSEKFKNEIKQNSKYFFEYVPEDHYIAFLKIVDNELVSLLSQISKYERFPIIKAIGKELNTVITDDCQLIDILKLLSKDNRLEYLQILADKIKNITAKTQAEILVEIRPAHYTSFLKLLENVELAEILQYFDKNRRFEIIKLLGPELNTFLKNDQLIDVLKLIPEVELAEILKFFDKKRRFAIIMSLGSELNNFLENNQLIDVLKLIPKSDKTHIIFNYGKIQFIINALIEDLLQKYSNDTKICQKVNQIIFIKAWLSRDSIIDNNSYRLLLLLVRDICAASSGFFGFFSVPEELGIFYDLIKRYKLCKEDLSLIPTQYSNAMLNDLPQELNKICESLNERNKLSDDGAKKSDTNNPIDEERYNSQEEKEFTNFATAGMLSMWNPLITRLNNLQKNIIEGYLNYLFDNLSSLTLDKQIDALQAIKRPVLSEKAIANFTEMDAWDTIQEIRDILKHPCPQNRYNGNGNAFKHEHLKGRAPITSEETKAAETGVYEGMVYSYSSGFGSTVYTEPQGIFGLTGRNRITPPRSSQLFLSSELPTCNLNIKNSIVIINNKYTLENKRGNYHSNHRLKFYYIDDKGEAKKINIDEIAVLEKELNTLGLLSLLTEKSEDLISLDEKLKSINDEKISDKFKACILGHADLGAPEITEEDVRLYIHELVDIKLKTCFEAKGVFDQKEIWKGLPIGIGLNIASFFDRKMASTIAQTCTSANNLACEKRDSYIQKNGKSY